SAWSVRGVFLSGRKECWCKGEPEFAGFIAANCVGDRFIGTAAGEFGRRAIEFADSPDFLWFRWGSASCYEKCDDKDSFSKGHGFWGVLFISVDQSAAADRPSEGVRLVCSRLRKR